MLVLEFEMARQERANRFPVILDLLVFDERMAMVLVFVVVEVCPCSHPCSMSSTNNRWAVRVFSTDGRETNSSARGSILRLACPRRLHLHGTAHKTGNG